MAKKNSVAFIALFLILFVITISEIGRVKGELCEKASKTWSGNCGNTRHCDDQCKSWEGAAHGACHVRGGKHMCFCYFNCPKAQKLAEDKLKAQQDKVEHVKPPRYQKPKTPHFPNHP